MVVRLFSTSFRPTSSKRRSQSMSPRPSLPSAVLSSGGANRMTRGSSLSMSPTPLSNSSRPVSGLKNEKTAAASKERKSVASGKRGSVRVDLGGGGNITKKQKQ